MNASVARALQSMAVMRKIQITLSNDYSALGFAS